ncbi:MAG: hypothetical protein QGG09_07230 [Pirellulaceae bacterium]|jgi:hypothetical protein|nr:hypothetical protein [Pirellulaceae bacterium]HJN10436.1 hypothetical protein [Pirellulaceae bacterium]
MPILYPTCHHTRSFIRPPKGYWDEGTSDISKDITEGENTLTIELKAAGPAAQAGGAAAEDGETEE